MITSTYRAGIFCCRRGRNGASAERVFLNDHCVVTLNLTYNIRYVIVVIMKVTLGREKKIGVCIS